MPRTIAELTRIAHAHAAAEASGDLEATMATLEAEPVYDFHPVGLRMQGTELARRYYEHYFAKVAPRIAGFRLLGEWSNGLGVLQEYSVRYRYDDGREREFYVMGLLTFGSEKLAGERLYAETEFLGLLFGPVWNELTPI
jgi:hypothetical protein